MRFARMLALVAVGCGDDHRAPGDATPDAPEPTVSVRITRQSVPLANLAVFFHAADGTLVSSTTTCALRVTSGVATP